MTLATSGGEHVGAEVLDGREVVLRAVVGVGEDGLGRAAETGLGVECFAKVA